MPRVRNSSNTSWEIQIVWLKHFRQDTKEAFALQGPARRVPPQVSTILYQKNTNLLQVKDTSNRSLNLLVSSGSGSSNSADVCRWPFLARILLCNQSQRDEWVQQSRDPSFSSFRLQKKSAGRSAFNYANICWRHTRLYPHRFSAPYHTVVKSISFTIRSDFHNVLPFPSRLESDFCRGIYLRLYFHARALRGALSAPRGCHCLSPHTCNARTLLHVLLGNDFSTTTTHNGAASFATRTGDRVYVKTRIKTQSELKITESIVLLVHLHKSLCRFCEASIYRCSSTNCYALERFLQTVQSTRLLNPSASALVTFFCSASLLTESLLCLEHVPMFALLLYINARARVGNPCFFYFCVLHVQGVGTADPRSAATPLRSIAHQIYCSSEGAIGDNKRSYVLWPADFDSSAAGLLTLLICVPRLKSNSYSRSQMASYCTVYTVTSYYCTFC